MSKFVHHLYHMHCRSWDDSLPSGLLPCRSAAKSGQHKLCQLQTSVLPSRRCNNPRCCAGCLPRYPSHGCQPCLQVEPYWCCWCCYCRSAWPSVTLTQLGECGCPGGQEYLLSSCRAKPVYATQSIGYNLLFLGSVSSCLTIHDSKIKVYRILDYKFSRFGWLKLS